MGDGVRIGTRGSDLALVQARTVAGLLHQRLGVEPQLVVVSTAGDRDRASSLHDLPTTGFFTKELQAELLAGRVDLVAHSLKDLPTEEPAGLKLGAVLARGNPADMLLARPGAAGDGALGLRSGAVVGTSSLRRAAQALALQPGVRIAPLRGNVPTRVQRLREGPYDAIVLAAAGLERLALDLAGLRTTLLDPALFLPAPGQAAVAVEVRADDSRMRDLVAVLDDPPTATTTGCERALLRALEGGCSLPLGALAVAASGGKLVLRAALATLDERMTTAALRRAEVRGREPEETAALAHAVLTGAAS